MIWFHRRRKFVQHYEKDEIGGEKVWTVLRTAGRLKFNVINIPAAALEKLFDKFFKNICKKNGGMYEPDSSIKLSERHTRVIFVVLVFLYLPIVFLQKLHKVGSAPKRCHILLSWCQQTSAEFQPVFNLVQSASNEARGSLRKTPKINNNNNNVYFLYCAV